MALAGNYGSIGRKVIDIGSLDRRILIQSLTTTRSATGAEVVAWVDYKTVWASEEDAKTRSDELVLTDQEQAIHRTRFTIRYNPNIREKWRIIYNGNTFDIVIINEIGRRKFTELIAEYRT